ncbi:response regulator [Vibrio vulnificus]|uniref:response regulator n=1 Tax=Vibrio vulnificus TaxID=672 RepID=UPI001022C75A|nr:response regulator [Vibrio vulnificus]EGQ7832568.1 response regulator [Vibrio vulnificus]EGQ8022747.1 response regulator [Vibrio vulnificus]EHU4793676.1 response regulator [Vibrio vulnificus]EJA3294225.1 response regulator [Vibrio vulnificus]EJB0234607.1 response regulator [Vibrio vulnificus]
MKILIVEDGEYKVERVTSFIKDNFPNAECAIARSYSSANNAIVNCRYELIILDMSLPTFDKVNGTEGGEFRDYGGIDIARQIKRRKINSDFVFLTQHESFDDNETIEDIHIKSLQNYDERYKGSIFYEHSGYEWKEKLERIISKYA